jgi:hypothetical protein
MTKRRRKVYLTDPINMLDLSSLSPIDKLEIEMLKSAYDRAGPEAVAEGMVKLAKSHPALFDWLVRKLIE